MTIEFTKQELDYIAIKIAEILTNNAETLTHTFEIGDNEHKPGNERADVPIAYQGLSTRLYNVLRKAGLEYWTPRDLAYYSVNEYAKLRGMGKTHIKEFKGIVELSGLTFGRGKFKRGESHRELIIEKPLNGIFTEFEPRKGF